MIVLLDPDGKPVAQGRAGTKPCRPGLARRWSSRSLVANPQRWDIDQPEAVHGQDDS